MAQEAVKQSDKVIITSDNPRFEEPQDIINERTILVKPIHPKEEIQIVLKRYLEKIVLFFYARYQKKQNR